MIDPARRVDWELAAHGVVVQRGGRIVLDGVDIAVRRGECLSIIGPNGAGKTTLLLLLLGLLAPQRGEVVLDGAPLRRLSARARGRFASYVPQTTERVPQYTVRDAIDGARTPYVSALRPLSRDDRRVVAEAVASCGVAEIADRPLAELSAGERQRAMLAAAVAQDADVMFLDEPGNALDPAHQVDLVRLLRAWLERRRALVLVSHDLNLPAAVGGRVAALSQGRIAANGRAEDVLTPAVLRGVYGAEFDLLSTEDGRRYVAARLG